MRRGREGPFLRGTKLIKRVFRGGRKFDVDYHRVEREVRNEPDIIAKLEVKLRSGPISPFLTGAHLRKRISHHPVRMGIENVHVLSCIRHLRMYYGGRRQG